MCSQLSSALVSPRWNLSTPLLQKIGGGTQMYSNFVPKEGVLFGVNCLELEDSGAEGGQLGHGGGTRRGIVGGCQRPEAKGRQATPLPKMTDGKDLAPLVPEQEDGSQANGVQVPLCWGWGFLAHLHGGGCTGTRREPAREPRWGAVEPRDSWG